MQLRSVAEKLAEPNPSRKYCPLRTDAASSPSPPPFLPLSRLPLLFFFRWSHDPAATRRSSSCAPHARVVDDTRASSPSRASFLCSFITRPPFFPDVDTIAQPWEPSWRSNPFKRGEKSLIATVRSVNSRVSA